jgi:hypothetical protein
MDVRAEEDGREKWKEMMKVESCMGQQAPLIDGRNDIGKARAV